ncbi:MAG: MarR family transcriptional regulator [Candidatus Limivivens sp.]|nr:MarR family transcriptional regulator [Candidatus Limivivens sp.]
MEAYETLSTVLVKLFNDIMDIEGKAIITEEFRDISNNDMHIIAAVGLEGSKNMSTVARALKVTVGTLTIAVNNLVKKGYLSRVRSEEDRRVVLISLTEKGKRACRHHEKFHDEMIQATLKGLSEEETKVLVRALTNLTDFFRGYESGLR